MNPKAMGSFGRALVAYLGGDLRAELFRAEQTKMKCPNCGNETNVAVTREEHVYPELFLGLPTFWRFMSPKAAQATLAMIFVICIALVVLAFVWLDRGVWFVSLFAGLLALFEFYIFVACVRSLGKYRRKEFYKCGSCSLEWSWFRQNGKG